jgi:hypothetical protein
MKRPTKPRPAEADPGELPVSVPGKVLTEWERHAQKLIEQHFASVPFGIVQNVPVKGLGLPEALDFFAKTNLSEATRLLAKARELGLTVERAIEAMERAAKAETTERASPAPSDEARPKITGNSPRRRKQYMFTEEELHDPATVDRARDILADAEESRRIRQPISEDQRNDIRWADAFTRRIRKINRPEVI